MPVQYLLKGWFFIDLKESTREVQQYSGLKEQYSQFIDLVRYNPIDRIVLKSLCFAIQYDIVCSGIFCTFRSPHILLVKVLFNASLQRPCLMQYTS